TLELLGHGMDVAESAVECALDEDGGSPGRVMRHVGHPLRLVDGVGRREPDEHALIEGEHARAAHCVPDLVERSQEKAAGGAELRLCLRHLRLDHRVLGKGALETARRLLHRESAEGIQHAARDAESHARQARGGERPRRETVERSGGSSGESAYWGGTKTSVPVNASLPVPLSPLTCHTSTICAWSAGRSRVRSTTLPALFRRNDPSGSQMGACPPSHEA